MSKRYLGVLIALGAFAVPVSGAAASSSGTPHAVKLTGVRELLWLNPQSPPLCLPGTHITVMGSVRGTIGGTPTGRGAFFETGVCRVFDMAVGSGRYLFPGGSLRFNYRWVHDPSPPAPYVVKDVVTGGTGRYRSAAGTLRVTGVAQTHRKPGVSTNSVSGTLVF